MTNHNNHSENPSAFWDGFSASMDARFFTVMSSVERLAVAVSGGADSMALVHALSRYTHARGILLIAYTVDHGLRPEAKLEAEQVRTWLSSYDNVTHHILRWDHDDLPPGARIQERARQARYDLMFNDMNDKGVRHLFVAHHLDDQAETVLFRLSKGSGLSGLSAMRDMRERDGVTLCRPCLDIPKADVLSYCAENGIEYIHDPSNDDEKYARIRLRNSMNILAEEGLSAKRLGVLARRAQRANDALDYYADEYFRHNALIKSDRIDLKLLYLLNQPFEVFFRVVDLALNCMQSDGCGYGVRMEKLEVLCEDLYTAHDNGFRKRTLGGVIFSYDEKSETIILERE